MIDKREILDEAGTLGLNPHVVEKDYVLGWLLWAVGNHDEISGNWVFKGGTCLKKCFFETYRFSEDLDFTLIDPAQLDEAFLKNAFADLSAAIYDHTGIEIPINAQRIDLFRNPRGGMSCQARIAYRGPVSPRGANMPRIKFDLTADELLVLPPSRLGVFHPYSDEPENGITVTSYPYEEAFAEKTRALGERARPRDLYDVVNLFRNGDSRPRPAVMLDVLRRKCAFKGIQLPTFEELQPSRGLLEGSWRQMLAHQLRTLPSFDDFWDALPAFFAWLGSGLAPRSPAPYAVAADERVIRNRLFPIPASIPAHAHPALRGHLDVIRFAASNHLCVELRYQGSIRLIEPYSLRETRKGHVILHAHNRDKDAHRSYRLDRIEGASVTSETFIPRFAVELTHSGPVAILPTPSRALPTSFADPLSGARSTRSRGGIRSRRSPGLS
ncbi:MAG: nucleotidyl transferase AbiEii/AbiGii toxin family protein [Chloroflexota bacterium]|nr:nucleotidyl transferase AbiEii/AbiGii toxin family protein [Chloroflexota bacterium]